MGPTHKLAAAMSDGRSVLGAALEHVLSAGFARVGVVVGAPGGLDAAESAVREAMAADRRARVDVLVNEGWADGQAGSLQVGRGWADGLGAQAMVVALGDQPGLSPTAWRAVAAMTGTPIAVSAYPDGRRAHPVRLHRSIWDRLPTTGDVGAAALWRHRPDLVTEVTVDGDPTDIDTNLDLEIWVSRPPGPPPPRSSSPATDPPTPPPLR